MLGKRFNDNINIKKDHSCINIRYRKTSPCIIKDSINIDTVGLVQELSLNILTTSLQCIPLSPHESSPTCFRLCIIGVAGCALCPVYLTARKLNVKYLPFPWYVTPQIPAVMGSSHIPPTGSLSLLVFFFSSASLTVLLNVAQASA